jgi:hypothetical protein
MASALEQKLAAEEPSMEVDVGAEILKASTDESGFSNEPAMVSCLRP